VAASGIQCRQQRAHDPGERPARGLRHVGGTQIRAAAIPSTLSEHTLDGKRSAMEADFVHVGEDGNLMVIGVFLEAGGQDANPAFSALMAAAPKGEGEAVLNAAIDPASLLPKATRIFRYEGSLTTPPCSEVVEWNVFAAPVAVAQSDIERFKEPFPMSARPLQPVHRRILLTN
jgi:carbonic anhydrase